jgi:hypothetical protein
MRSGQKIAYLEARSASREAPSRCPTSDLLGRPRVKRYEDIVALGRGADRTGGVGRGFSGEASRALGVVCRVACRNASAPSCSVRHARDIGRYCATRKAIGLGVPGPLTDPRSHRGRSASAPAGTAGEAGVTTRRVSRQTR